MSQMDRLKDLSSKMIEVVLIDANPENWSGNGKELHELDRDERGDRYWCGKNANQMITAAVKLETLIAIHERKGSELSPKSMDELEARINSFEQKAKQRLKRVMND